MNTIYYLVQDYAVGLYLVSAVVLGWALVVINRVNQGQEVVWTNDRNIPPNATVAIMLVVILSALMTLTIVTMLTV